MDLTDEVLRERAERLCEELWEIDMPHDEIPVVVKALRAVRDEALERAKTIIRDAVHSGRGRLDSEDWAEEDAIRFIEALKTPPAREP